MEPEHSIVKCNVDDPGQGNGQCVCGRWSSNQARCTAVNGWSNQL